MQQNSANINLIYQYGLDVMASLGYTKEQANPTLSSINTELPLNTTNGQYIFPIVVGDPSIVASNVLLAKQDIFVAGAVKMFVCDATNPSAYKKLTYDNPVVFTAPERAALIALWNAKVSLKINGTVLVPYLDAQNFFAAPNTQQTATQVDGTNSSEDGWIPLPGGIVFNGQGGNEWTLSLISALSVIKPNSRVGFSFLGTLLQNASTAK